MGFGAIPGNGDQRWDRGKDKFPVKESGKCTSIDWRCRRGSGLQGSKTWLKNLV